MHLTNLFSACLLVFSLPLAAEDTHTKPTVRSFDVFDTLLSYLDKDPKSIFAIVEKKYPFPNFYNLRIEAEMRSDRTQDDIYHQLIAITGLSAEETQKLRAFEFATVLDNIFPIGCNLSQVQEGDVLVSDTGYSKENLLQIVQKIGLKKNVEIFATPGGKYYGHIWPTILSRYNVLWHLGDNRSSDVDSPIKYGIKGKWFWESDYTPLEKIVYDSQHVGIANLMRTLRLSNPYPVDSVPYQVWEEQAQLNVPILILASLYLDDFSKKNGKQRILFSSRDCCHFVNIFKKLFPTYDALYFYSSRNAYYNPSPAYLAYVKSVYTPQTIIVDGFGTGTSCNHFFSTHMGCSPCYIAIVRAYHLGLGISKEWGDHIEDNIEKINYAAEGSLIGYNENGPLRLPVEYDVEYLKPAYACIDRCLELMDHYQMGSFDQTLIDKLIGTLQQRGYVLSPYITHCGLHNL